MLFTYYIPLATLFVMTICQRMTESSSPARSTDGPVTTAPPTSTGGASPSQSREFKAAMSAYYASLRDTPTYSSLAIDFGLNLDASVLNSLTRSPLALLHIPSTFDLRSLATNPPLTFTTAPWERDLPGTDGAEFKSIQTSVALEAASIGQSVLGISTSIPTPRATLSQTGAAPAMVAARPTDAAAVLGAAGLVAGVAAIVL